MSIKRKIKIAILVALKWLGLFWLIRKTRRNGLKILCYHGFSMDGQHLYEPGMFMREETFRNRMTFLRDKGFVVLPLGEALEKLYRNELPRDTVAITIDDGWFSTYSIAFPILRELKIPSMVYITTSYALQQLPIFNMVVRHLFWKTRVSVFTLSDVLPGHPADAIHLKDPLARVAAQKATIEYGNTLSMEDRDSVARKIAEKLQVDYPKIVESRMFGLMTLEEIKELSNRQVDIELHTHTHNFPAGDDATATEEIVQNRHYLETIAKNRDHFCYPSGSFKKEQWGVLEKLGIKSATTCIPGTNYKDTPRYHLYRFLDGENVSPIEFEAELCGVLDFFRIMKLCK